MKNLARKVDSRISFRLGIVAIIVALILAVVSAVQVHELIAHGQPVDGSLFNLELKWQQWNTQYHKLVATFWFAYTALALFIFIMFAKVCVRKNLLH